jgi:hypothetical protein
MEFREVVAAKKFRLAIEGKKHAWPKSSIFSGEYRDGSFLTSLLSFTTIVRDGAKPTNADAIISWKQDRDQQRHTMSEAAYFVNGEEIGSGKQGFLAVLKRIELLDDGASVRIDPVCIRTHGPFSDPVLMKGHRHFETTGEEPFREQIDLLADAARRKRLRVEIIPDEAHANHLPAGR